MSRISSAVLALGMVVGGVVWRVEAVARRGWGGVLNPIDRVKTGTDGGHFVQPIHAG